MADSTVNILFRLKDAAQKGLKKLKKTTAGVNDEFDELGKKKTEKVTRQVKELAQGLDTLVGNSKQAAKGFDNLKSSATKLVGIGAAISGVFVFAAKAAGEFSLQIAEIGTLVPDVVQSNKELARSVVLVSSQFGQKRAATAEAYYNAVSTGAKAGAEATQLLVTASQLAIGGVTDINTSVKALTSIINAYGLSMHDAELVSDSLFTTVKSGATTVDQLAAALFNVAPAAAIMGADFREVNAAIATLTLSGTPTSIATTQIRQALVALATETPEIIDALEGYTSATESIAKQGLAGTFDAITKAAGNTLGGVQKLVGSVEAASGIIGLAGDKSDAFARNLDEQTRALGATARAADEVAESFGFKLNTALNSVSNAFLGLGTALTPALDGLTVSMGNLADSLERLLASFPKTSTHVVTFIAVIGAALVAVASLGIAALGLAVGFGAAKTQFSGAIKFLSGLTIRAGIATFAVRALTGALRLVGGPIGIAVSALVYLAFQLIDFGSAAQDAAEDVKRLADNIETMSAIGKIDTLVKAEKAFNDLHEQAKKGTEQVLELERQISEGGVGEFIARFRITGVAEATDKLWEQTQDALKTLETVDLAASVLTGENVSLGQYVQGKEILEELANEADRLAKNLEVATAEADAFKPAKVVGGGRNKRVIPEEAAKHRTEAEIQGIARLKKAQTENANHQQKLGDLLADYERRIEDEKADLAARNRKAAAKKTLDEQIQAAKEVTALLKAQDQKRKALSEEDRARFLLKLSAEERALKASRDADLITENEYYAARGNLAKRDAANELQILKDNMNATQAIQASELQAAELAKSSDAVVDAINTRYDTARSTLVQQTVKLAADLQKKLDDWAAEAAEAGVAGVNKRVAKLISDLDTEMAVINQKRETGLISRSQASTDIIAAQDRVTASLEDELVVLEKINETGQGGPAVKEALKTVNDAIRSNTVRLSEFGQKLKAQSETAFTGFFDESLKDISNVGDAFDTLVKNIGDSIRGLIAERLSKALINSLFGDETFLGGLFSSGGGSVKTATPAGGGYIKAAGGGIMKLAGGGGTVRGRGTATSDSIPAMLSDGEYVINAASVSKYGANMLEAINRGKAPHMDVDRFSLTRPPFRRFAGGGSVGPPSLSDAMAGAGGGNGVTQLEVTGAALNMTLRDFLEREYASTLATR